MAYGSHISIFYKEREKGRNGALKWSISIRKNQLPTKTFERTMYPRLPLSFFLLVFLPSWTLSVICHVKRRQETENRQLDCGVEGSGRCYEEEDIGGLIFWKRPRCRCIKCKLCSWIGEGLPRPD